MTIEMTDIKLKYVTIAEARAMSGLRIVLGAYPIPGPWRESCKGVFHVKGLSYTAVKSANADASDLAIGMHNTQSELIEWTGQGSAPVVALNDERPRSGWLEQLHLAERLNPEPPLIPATSADRILMFGMANELLGEQGLVWLKRLLMVHEPLLSLPEGDPNRPFFEFLGQKYGYTPAGAERSAVLITEILERFAEQLARQQAAGKRYLVGDRLSALDIYWAASCGLLDPMPAERCPMADAFRGAYGNRDPRIAAALTPALLAHRDFIYDTHLEMPIVF
jgi:glutathione S-transferase